MRPAGESEFGIRFYDNIKAYPKGSTLFKTFPASRQSLAIRPEWNSMSEFIQWRIRPGTMLIEGRATSQGPYLSGGQIQIVVPSFLKDLIGVGEFIP